MKRYLLRAFIVLDVVLIGLVSFLLVGNHPDPFSGMQRQRLSVKPEASGVIVSVSPDEGSMKSLAEAPEVLELELRRIDPPIPLETKSAVGRLKRRARELVLRRARCDALKISSAVLRREGVEPGAIDLAAKDGARFYLRIRTGDRKRILRLSAREGCFVEAPPAADHERDAAVSYHLLAF